MAKTERKRMIVTFKPKDKRADKTTDKADILRSEVGIALHVVDSGTAAFTDSLSEADDLDHLALDINEYEVPVMVASLTDEEIAALKKNGNVAALEEDTLCYALGADALLVEGQPSISAETIPAGVAQIKAPPAWGCSRGAGVRVAVLDTGIDFEHPDLRPNYRGGVSFISSEPTPMDFNGHGTHCAGTIGAAINGSGVVGVAPAADLFAVKVLPRSGGGPWSGVIAGIEWAIRQRIHIVSMSLGADSAPSAVEAMCNLAWNRGLLLVAAAGNTRPNGGPVDAPAKFRSVIAVGAITSSNTRAPFSDNGPEVELCAPGVDVLSTMPRNSYGRMSGTSMACPHVAGAAALAWGSHRFSNNVTIRRLLAWTADDLGTPGRDPHFGFGRVDAYQAAATFVQPPVVPGLPSGPL